MRNSEGLVCRLPGWRGLSYGEVALIECYCVGIRGEARIAQAINYSTTYIKTLRMAARRKSGAKDLTNMIALYERDCLELYAAWSIYYLRSE